MNILKIKQILAKIKKMVMFKYHYKITEREDQINIEGALAYGNVIELIEDGCILQKGMENNDEYAMPIGREEQNQGR